MTMLVATYSHNRSVLISASLGDSLGQEVDIQEPDCTKSPEPFVLETMVDNLLSSHGQKKQSFATQILDRISHDDYAAENAAWAAFMILKSRKPGRVDDCLGLFSRLNSTTIRDAVNDAISGWPPGPEGMQQWAKDYWYVLVRIILRDSMPVESPQREVMIDIASHFPVDAIREAAVEALADSDVPEHRALLKEIADNDESPPIRRLAAELIE